MLTLVTPCLFGGVKRLSVVCLFSVQRYLTIYSVKQLLNQTVFEIIDVCVPDSDQNGFYSPHFAANLIVTKMVSILRILLLTSSHIFLQLWQKNLAANFT